MPTVLAHPPVILHPTQPATSFQITRYQVSPELSAFIDYYWLSCWDLPPGISYCSDNLPYPTVHLTFSSQQAIIQGALHGRFSTLLKGRDTSFGVRFKPGAFHAFYPHPLRTLTDCALPASELLPVTAIEAIEQARAAVEIANLIDLVETALLSLHPRYESSHTLIASMLETILANPAQATASSLATQYGLSIRSMQRLFDTYLGLSPFWVIKRYRLHQLAQQLAHNSEPHWAHLAAELGYFDQAHFIKDFKRVLGATPVDYVQQLGSDSYSSPTCVVLHRVSSSASER